MTQVEKSQIAQINSPVLAVTTNQEGYIQARKEADKLAAKHGLTVYDAPLAIQAITSLPEVCMMIRRPDTIHKNMVPEWISIDTITCEYNGLRDGERYYEVWHSVGSLSTEEGIKKAFSKAGCGHHIGNIHDPELRRNFDESAYFCYDRYKFLYIRDDEWVAVGKGNYNGQNATRVHLDDVKKGNVPAPGTPYTIFVRIDKDAPKINGECQLSRDAFMRDDKILMIAGSPDSREALAKMIFGSKKEGGEGWTSCKNSYRIENFRSGGESWNLIKKSHRIGKDFFNAQAKGRPVCLNAGDGGFDCSSIDYYGIFLVGVNAEGAVRAKNATLEFVKPTLEQILAVISNPALSREEMLNAASQLYGR